LNIHKLINFLNIDFEHQLIVRFLSIVKK